MRWLTGTGFKATLAKGLSVVTFCWTIYKYSSLNGEGQCAHLWIAFSPHQSSVNMKNTQSTPELKSYWIPRTCCKGNTCALILEKSWRPIRSLSLNSGSRSVHGPEFSKSWTNVHSILQAAWAWGSRALQAQGYNSPHQLLILANGACNCAFFIDSLHWPRT